MATRLADGVYGGMRCKVNDLFEYGIQTENSDIRAHVSVINRAIYVYETRKGLEAIEKHKPKQAYASQRGVDGFTGLGWLVRPDMIDGLISLKYVSWQHWGLFKESMTTSEKGDLAVKCVCDCIKIGRFPFWIDASEENRESVQIKGVDIVVFCKKKIQVKCDWRSGPAPGTGNLFLQSAERNPKKQT